MMITGVFVSHPGKKCGVYQFGRRLFQALSSSAEIHWQYVECASSAELDAAVKHRPRVVVINYVPFTMPWLTSSLLEDLPSIVFGIMHETYQKAADELRPNGFDFMLCPDPTLIPRNPIALTVPRFIPESPINNGLLPQLFTVGSFGFATRGKGFERICALVNEQFNVAQIKINMPPHDSADMVSPEYIKEIANKCRDQITKSGIQLSISFDFLDESDLLQFLGGNTINVFAYDDMAARGISSCTDYALACGRPLAVNRSTMFRHLHGANPSILIEERSLEEIVASGTMAIKALAKEFSPAESGASWNRQILSAIKRSELSSSTPDRRGLNKILDDRSRVAYSQSISDLERLAPQVFARKIERANIQQGFTLETVRRFAEIYPCPRILAVGSYEDTAVAALRASGFRIEEIDPNVNNLDLEEFYVNSSEKLSYYDLILSVSVLEHVERDEEFVRMLAEFLAPGGLAIFTVDFSNNYAITHLKPQCDWRLYTAVDLRTRLMARIPNCALVDTDSWEDGGDDFEFGEYRYAFASWVFTKINPDRASLTSKAVWSEMLQEERIGVQMTKRDPAGQNDDLSAQVDRLERKLGSMERSASWRITEPLRYLSRLLLRAKGALHEKVMPNQGA